MSNQQDLRQRREALAQAVNSRDLEAVLSFIHPSFVGKSRRGFSVGYQDMVRMVEQLFAPGKDYQETMEIEEIEVSGDSAKLVVRRIERGRLHNPREFRTFVGLGIMFLSLAIVNVIRAGEWDFQQVFGVGGFAVGGVASIWWAFFMFRRSVHRTVRCQETWRTIDGHWLLVEEQEL